jgi:hypothetical protein
MRHPHFVKAYTIKAHTVKGHQVKARWAKKQHVKAVHIKGHMVGVVTKKVVKTTPTKKQWSPGDELGMCAVTAAGLAVGGYTRTELKRTYQLLSPLDDGVTIPDAIRALGYEPVEADELAEGVILGFPDHAVVIDKVTRDGLLVITWGEEHFISWNYVSANGGEAWLSCIS